MSSSLADAAQRRTHPGRNLQCPHSRRQL